MMIRILHKDMRSSFAFCSLLRPCGRPVADVIRTRNDDVNPPLAQRQRFRCLRADRQGGGLAGKTLAVIRGRATATATATGLRRVIAPVRPALKSRYPLAPMENFA
jgi:hypothetical protein